ncbi:hypothetical protein BDR03DRAFT_618396 [Suillus americanus]|nr:hypothetical protein BDR03DRAFT_618396 [Suillus americanus]
MHSRRRTSRASCRLSRAPMLLPLRNHQLQLSPLPMSASCSSILPLPAYAPPSSSTCVLVERQYWQNGQYSSDSFIDGRSISDSQNQTMQGTEAAPILFFHL